MKEWRALKKEEALLFFEPIVHNEDIRFLPLLGHQALVH